MRYTYLLIDFFTVIFPFIFSFDSKVRFYTRWKYYLPALFFTATFFLVWDYFETLHGVWSFSERYTIGLRLFGMPIEEYLFFLAIPYACTFIYASLGFYIKRRIFSDRMISILWPLSVLMLFSSAFVIHKAYTFPVLLLLGFLLPLSMSILKLDSIDRFLQMYFLSLIPMLIVNGILTSLPIVIYDNSQNIGIRLGTIPLEDFLYSAIMLLMNISIYERIAVVR